MPIETKTTLLDITAITIPEDRLRERLDKTHANNLAEAIAKHDLLHAPVVDRDSHTLIAGAHRLAAWDINKFLERECPNPDYQGWTRIPVRLAYDVTPEELMALELLENIQTKQMSWKEVANSVAKIHNSISQTSEQPRQTTARLLNMSEQTVGNNLKAAQYLANNNELVHAATSLTGAINVIQRLEERLFDDIKESIRIGVSVNEAIEALPTEGAAKPTESVPAAEKQMALSIPAPALSPTPTSSSFLAIQADFIEWAATYSGTRFNLIHCDFPYGIDYDKTGFNYAKQTSIYADSKDLYFALLAAFVNNTQKLVTDSAHLIFWYNTRYHSETVRMLETAGWKVWPHQLIWHKSDNAGVLADPKRGPRHTYETALFASRGDRKLVKPVADSFSHGTTRESGHPSEKPRAVLEHFFTLTVDSSTRILDPTAGSFNSLLAAKAKGANSGVGIELDPDFVRRGARVLDS